MKKTARELIEIINQNDLLDVLFNDEIEYAKLEDADGNNVDDSKDYITNVLGLGELEYKDGRYDTSEFWQVIYFKDHDVYLKIYGEYDSYGQGEHSYDGIKEVKPKEVTIIKYE